MYGNLSFIDKYFYFFLWLLCFCAMLLLHFLDKSFVSFCDLNLLMYFITFLCFALLFAIVVKLVLRITWRFPVTQYKHKSTNHANTFSWRPARPPPTMMHILVTVKSGSAPPRQRSLTAPTYYRYRTGPQRPPRVYCAGPRRYLSFRSPHYVCSRDHSRARQARTHTGFLVPSVLRCACS